MRKVTVPVDMTSEQKTLLGVLSKRQLIYLLGGGQLFIYMYHFYGGYLHPLMR